MSIREDIITRVIEAGGRLKVRSALNPVLWLCAIITVPSLLIFAIRPDAPSWLLVFAFVPEAAAILGFFFLLLVDRDKLQSEEYQIRKMQLEMIEQKGLPPVPANAVEIVTDPETPSLLIGGNDETE